MWSAKGLKWKKLYLCERYKAKTVWSCMANTESALKYLTLVEVILFLAENRLKTHFGHFTLVIVKTCQKICQKICRIKISEKKREKCQKNCQTIYHKNQSVPKNLTKKRTKICQNFGQDLQKIAKKLSILIL